jgi:uncharacterized protein
MDRRLTSATTLENLKKEAKRWLKAIRAGDGEARDRLRRAHPDAPAEPGLRDIQHALAREHGLAGWTALREALADRSLGGQEHAERVAKFLEYACPDHHIRGGSAHTMARHAAERILKRHPEIARDSIYTAVVCGELKEVQRILADRPQAAAAKNPAAGADRGGAGGSEDLFRDLGPKAWEPLLYHCFTRLSLPGVTDNALAIARLLLDHGADPKAFFMAGDSRYTPLVGVIGEGEEHRPAHQERDALTSLLLERGANPYDGQVFYNLHFHGDILWFLKLIYEHSGKIGRQSDWDDPDWPMIDMGGYGAGARYLLGIAVNRNDLELAEWLLARGANANASLPPQSRQPQRTLYDEALMRGYVELAELLARHGATLGQRFPPGGAQAFTAACLRLDRPAVQAMLAEHPDYLLSPTALHTAAAQERVDVVTFLLDLGISPDVVDPERGGQTALHVAAYNDALGVATLLIERGASIDPRESNYGNTPIWTAIWATRPRLIELLGRFSRDVWGLAFIGNVERLREILTAKPELAKVGGEHETPLMWLPDDEARAREIVELLLSHGADPGARNQQGLTAADLARKRGMDEVARMLSR